MAQGPMYGEQRTIYLFSLLSAPSPVWKLALLDCANLRGR